MAFEKGTASGFDDILDKLVAFLTTNPELVAANQQYEVVFDKTMPFLGQTAVQPNRRHVVFLGKGLSGLDQIYTSVSQMSDTAGDYFNLGINGGLGFLESSLPPGYPDLLSGLISGSAESQFLLLWNQPMTYWFFANGRRWFMVAKVSTIYEAGGAGFILPPCPPTEYRYPLALWGTSTSGTIRWSTTTGSSHSGMVSGRCRLRDPGGVWRSHRGNDGSGGSSSFLILPTGCGSFAYRHPTGENQSGVADAAFTVLSNMRDGPDGSFPLWPVTLITTPDSSFNVGRNNYGEADGLFWVPTLNSGAEDEIEADGSTYIVFQSAFRANNPYLFALRK